ncbi:hypothetical protein [Streptomyces sp. NPDC088557]|uniref:hypothetical protein n=1 Tax=Streptomyces sp. NPDC088557 TaxID=3365867 RepID=UPI00382B2DD8
MTERLTSRHEQELRDLNPAEHPNVAVLLSKIDGQRSVIRGKDDKIERQRARIRVGQEELVKRNEQIAEQAAEIQRLHEQIARLQQRPETSG